MQEKDIIQEYIELKKLSKETDEKLLALEILIFDEKSKYVDDGRITLVDPRETVSITEECYDKLEMTDINTWIIIPETKRRMTFKDFDINTQNQIKNNPNNFESKFSKPSIRVK